MNGTQAHPANNNGTLPKPLRDYPTGWDHQDASGLIDAELVVMPGWAAIECYLHRYDSAGQRVSSEGLTRTEGAALLRAWRRAGWHRHRAEAR